jgi:ribosomal 50S subunit-recycling heat shock protein
VSRLIKRRTVANELCQRGKVTVNGQNAKAGKELAEGDVLAITFVSSPGLHPPGGADYTVVYEVVEVPSANVPKAKAPTLYRQIKGEPPKINSYD